MLLFFSNLNNLDQLKPMDQRFNDTKFNKAISSSPASVQAKTTITINTSKAGTNIEVLKECIKELDWQECPNGLSNQNCDIIWQSTNCSNEQEQQQQFNYNTNPTKINKFPCK